MDTCGTSSSNQFASGGPRCGDAVMPSRVKASLPSINASDETPSGSVPAIPQWAITLTDGQSRTRRMVLPVEHSSPAPSCEITVRTGQDAALVTVLFESANEWTSSSFGSTTEHMLSLVLDELSNTPFPKPTRSWNFLPDICAPLENGIDRYRAFNIARYRAFSSFFGESIISQGRVPPASCIGHWGSPILIAMLGTRNGVVSVENPRQVPAFEYSPKFGPRPPCFARAGLTTIGNKPMLLVAGTASVLGEESVHSGSLDAQIQETLLNLRAILAEGARLHGQTLNTRDIDPLSTVAATRVYYRRQEDQPTLARMLPPELTNSDVEYVHAEICRCELLLEIEVVADVGSA